MLRSTKTDNGVSNNGKIQTFTCEPENNPQKQNLWNYASQWHQDT